jgi:hypothetical protein
MRGAAGGSGVGSLAQSVANQQARNLQGISGSIGQQEARNQQLAAQGQLQVDAMIGQGEQNRQLREGQKRAGLLGMSQMDVAMEQQRMDAAIGAVGQSVGQLGGAISDQSQLNKINKANADAKAGLQVGKFSGQTTPGSATFSSTEGFGETTTAAVTTGAKANIGTTTQDLHKAWEAAGGEGFVLNTETGTTSYGGSNLGNIRGIMGSDYVGQFGTVPDWLKQWDYTKWKADAQSVGFNRRGARIN